MGQLPSNENMPSVKIITPSHNTVFKSGQEFSVQAVTNNLETSNAVNAQSNFLSAPQQLNAQGVIKGHIHVVIEEISSFTQNTPTDPKSFAFFKEISGAGSLATNITGGLSEGFYRLSITTRAANHQPVLVPISQRGALNDVTYVRTSTITMVNNC